MVRVPPPGLAQPKAAAAKQAPVKQEAVAQASKPEQARRQAQLTPQVCNSSASQLQTGMKACSCCHPVSRLAACEVPPLVISQLQVCMAAAAGALTAASWLRAVPGLAGDAASWNA